MDKEMRRIISRYREFADIAWSEVTDKVHTVEEYQVALKSIEDKALEEIQALITTSLIDEFYSFKEAVPPYGMLTQKQVIDLIDQRIKELKE